MRRAQVLWLVLLSGCLQPTDEVKAKLEGPLSVELHFTRRRGGLKEAWIVENHELRVTADGKTRSIDAPCSGPRAEIVGDGGATRFAHRCDKGQPWSVVYVGKKGLFRADLPALGSGDAPTWSAAPTTVSQAAADALAFIEAHWYESAHRALYAEMARAPAEDVAVFLVATIERRVSFPEWPELYEGLPAEPKKAVASRLGPILSAPVGEGIAYCNAAMIVDPSDAAWRTNAPARLDEIAGFKGDLPCPQLIRKLLPAARATDGERAAAAACRLAARGDFVQHEGDYRAASPPFYAVLDALAASTERCAAIDEAVKANACAPGLFKDKPPTEVEAKAALAAIRAETEALPSPYDHATSERAMRALLGLAIQKGAKLDAFSCADAKASAK